MSDSSDRLLQYHHQQPGETHALSHLGGYGGEMENIEAASSEKTPPFSSGLPTPPHLVPISSEADGNTTNTVCNMSPLSSSSASGSSTIKEPSFFGKWSPGDHSSYPPPTAAGNMQDYSEPFWNSSSCSLTAAHLALKQPSAANAMFFSPVSHPGEGEPSHQYTPSLFTLPAHTLCLVNSCFCEQDSY